jgi:hypothetical protein
MAAQRVFACCEGVGDGVVTKVVTAAAALVLIASAPSAAKAVRADGPPTLTLTSVSVKRKPSGVTAYLNFCLSPGPGAAVITTETRKVGRRVVARDVSNDPLGVDLSTVQPRECVTRWLESWVVPGRLMGAGTYSVSIRVKDGYAQLSKAVGFSFLPGV